MPDTTAIDLAYACKLPPEQIIAYFRSKGFAISFDWQEMLGEAHTKAFTVAKATRLDILQDIRDAVQSAIDDGTTLEQFQKQLMPILKTKGWWGKQEVLNEATGELRQVQLGSPYRLQTIYQTNLQTAYMAGRYQSQIQNVTDRPYWMYVAVMDGRTRPAHRALNGKVFRYDDPIWNYIYTPNGFRCRCRVRALSAEEVAAMGLTVESSEGKLSFIDVPAGGDGTMVSVARYQGVDDFGKTFSFSPDAGWSYNPGITDWQPEPTRWSPEIRGLW